MKDLVISEEEGLIVVRALYTVALADGALDERERLYLEMHRDLLGRVAQKALDLDRLEPIDPADVGAVLTGKGQREALVQRLVIMTMLDGPTRLSVGQWSQWGRIERVEWLHESRNGSGCCPSATEYCVW